MTLFHHHVPACRKGGNKWCFCPSVAYVANNSRTRRPSVHEFGMKVPHHWCDSHTSFKVKRSKVKVTTPVDAVTHRAPYIFPTARPSNFRLGIQMAYDDPHQPLGAMTSKVKGQGHVISLSLLGPMLYLSLEAGRGIPCRPNPASTLLFRLTIFTSVIRVT